VTQEEINTLCLNLSKSVRKEVESEMFTWQLDLTTGDAAEASYKVMMRYIDEYVTAFVSKALAIVLQAKQ
jgi:hypothetical protein